MEKRFLGVWRDVDGDLRLRIAQQATPLLGLNHALASPLFPAAPVGKPAILRESGAVVFLVPRSPTALLARLMNDEGREVADNVYISHGHASAVLLLDGADEAGDLLSRLDTDLLGYEMWPYEDGRLLRGQCQLREPTLPADWTPPSDIVPVGVSFEAEAQFRQFNANLAVFAQVGARYSPELEPVVIWLSNSMSGVSVELGELARDAEQDTAIRRSIALESVLVEANAVLTIYSSQVGSGSLPLAGSRFPVGEYSLLGIGGMCRAAWRIYSHLNETFARFDHAGLLSRSYRSMPPFDPFAPLRQFHYRSWAESGAGLATIADSQPGEARQHLPYFSSRWGFHESLHSISMSWQCLHASATKEWNLLTLTHEFLHAHVRGILAHVLDVDTAGSARLVQLYNDRESGTNAHEAMQVAYIRAIVGIMSTGRLAEQITGQTEESLTSTSPGRIDSKALQRLVRSHNLLLQEIVVHVLDFLYVYDGRDDDYVNSIWSSWSLVPSVNDRIEHYVLRTVCALAVTSPKKHPTEVFEDAADRLEASIAPLITRARLRPAIHAALATLQQLQSRRRIGAQFIGAMYVVELTRHFLYDPELNAALVRDDHTTVIDGQRTYAVQVGDYLGEGIASPVGFLLDRFKDYSDQAGEAETEYESIWQMLLLT